MRHPRVTKEQVGIVVDQYAALTSLNQLRKDVIAHLARVSYQQSLQHARVLAHFRTEAQRRAFLAWADEHVVSTDLEARSDARLLRKILERSDTTPLDVEFPTDVKLP